MPTASAAASTATGFRATGTPASHEQQVQLACDGGTYRLLIAGGVDPRDPCRFPLENREVARPHTLKEPGVFRLEPVSGLRPAAGPLERHGHGRVEKQGQVRPPAPLGNLLEGAYVLERHAAPCPLVGLGRIRETVAQYPATARQRRFDQVAHVDARYASGVAVRWVPNSLPAADSVAGVQDKRVRYGL